MDKILDRIVKLLKLSKSTNEHEAATAAARAAEMMAEHELSEADLRVKLEEQSGESKPAEAIEKGTVEGKVYKKVDVWRSHLLGGLAHGFGCHSWWQTGMGEVRIRLLGRKTNVQTVSYMFPYLENEVERLCKEAFQAMPKGERPVAAAATARYNSFKLGAAQVIRARLAEMRANKFKPHTGTAIVVVDGERTFASAPPQDQSKAMVLVRKDQDEVDKVYKVERKRMGLHSMGGGSGPRNMGAYQQGQGAGRGINLSGGRSLAAPSKQIRGWTVKCPWCKSDNIEMDTVDNGVGEQQCGPACCLDCGATQLASDLAFTTGDNAEASQEERAMGWSKGAK